MTLCELIENVRRDMAEVAPKLYWNVEFVLRHWTHTRPGGEEEVVFRIYHESGLLGVDASGTFYDGETPQQAYEKFLAAISKPATPPLHEVLALCDTPNGEAVGS